MIQLSEILAPIRSRGLLAADGPSADIAVSGISDDSRQVRPGDLYCAIRGYVHDGHNFLKEAEEAGAMAALVETAQDVALPQVRVLDTRRAASIAAQVVYGYPAGGLRLVGVTGTNGKSTTVQLARQILSHAGHRCGSIGTLGVFLADGRHETTRLTTPGPIEFARLLAELGRTGTEYVIAEVSSHALDQGRVDAVEFEVGVFTNLTRDHLDYHSSLDEYRAAKSRLAELVSAAGALVVNADESAWTALAADRRALRYGITRDAELRGVGIELDSRGSRWTLVTNGGEFPVAFPLLGEFNVYNALAAAGVGVALGLDAAEVAEALGRVSAISGRLEVLAEGPLILRDYAHTPDALRRALQALRPVVDGRLILVFGCGGDRDRGKRPLMGEAAARGADLSIVTSDNPRTEDPTAIIADVLPGLGDAPHEVIADRREAIARAIEMARREDAILLAGKGHEVYQVIGEERRPFDESLIVRELLREREGEG